MSPSFFVANGTNTLCLANSVSPAPIASAPSNSSIVAPEPTNTMSCANCYTSSHTGMLLGGTLGGVVVLAAAVFAAYRFLASRIALRRHARHYSSMEDMKGLQGHSRSFTPASPPTREKPLPTPSRSPSPSPIHIPVLPPIPTSSALHTPSLSPATPAPPHPLESVTNNAPDPIPAPAPDPVPPHIVTRASKPAPLSIPDTKPRPRPRPLPPIPFNTPRSHFSPTSDISSPQQAVESSPPSAISRTFIAAALAKLDTNLARAHAPSSHTTPHTRRSVYEQSDSASSMWARRFSSGSSWSAALSRRSSPVPSSATSQMYRVRDSALSAWALVRSRSRDDADSAKESPGLVPHRKAASFDAPKRVRSVTAIPDVPPLPARFRTEGRQSVG
ncbi:hypothetical protein C8Q76DRAFT_754192 [Earliella scabrosa]|nr:hypothetical protein C8Q76DRAFT_754192 [Earliella scabrosa]